MGWWNKLVRDKKEKEMNKQQTWTVEVIKDGKTEELVIQLPTDMLNQMGWDVGDTLLWEEDTVAGVPTFKLKKKNS